MTSRARLLLIAAAVGLLAATAAGMYIYVLQSRAVREAKPVTVLVAGEDIAQGTPTAIIVGESMFQRRRIPFRYLPPGYLTNMRSVAGRVAASDIGKGEILTRKRFVSRSKIAPGAGMVPKNKLAVGFEVTDATGVSGLARPGSRVVVFATMSPGPKGKDITKVIISNAPVVKMNVAGGRTGASAKKTIVLALSPSQAEKAVFAAEQGTLWMGLQGQGAKVAVVGKGVTVDNLFVK